MATSTFVDQVQNIFIAFYGRPADPAGLEYWADELEAANGDVSAIIDAFANSAEYDDQYGSLSNQELVEALYLQVLGREGEEAGVDFYVGELEAGNITKGGIALAILNGALGGDAVTMENRKAVADAFSAAVEAGDKVYGDDELASAKALLAGVDADSDVDAAIADAQALVNGYPDVSGPVEPPVEGEVLTLTQQQDTLTGTDADDTFQAPVTQNETGSGALANTLETGDVLDGGEGLDTLKADLIASGSISDNWAPAISATTTSIEEVYLRAQATNVDNGASNTTFGATIDAERMEGVKEWWSDNSRANILVEDVRNRADDVTIGMTETDPNVSFGVFFNPLYMEGDVASASDLTINIQEITDGQAPSATELENITVREINFSLDGVAYTLSSDEMSAANTWAELEVAIDNALAEQADLADLTVEHTGNGMFVINDQSGGTFEVEDGEALIFGAAADIDVRNRVEVGRITEEGPTSTNIVLDGVGNGSQGGMLNVAAMSGDRGIEVFNVEVDRDSHLANMRSENNPRDTASGYEREQQLEEVYVSHVDGGEGSLQIGTRTVDAFGVSTTTDDRLNTNGLTDVRVFDATGFGAELKLGASLTAQVFDKYLDGAAEPVQFSYLLGDAGSNLSLAVADEVADDADFTLEVMGGASDDRINLSGLTVKDSTTVDGAEGNNIVEVTTTTGAASSYVPTTGGAAVAVTAEETAFAGFENIETLVVAGTNNTTQNIVDGNMAGLETIIVATEAGVSTRLEELDMDTTVSVSGKNQTLGNGNSNLDQTFGTVTLDDTNAVPGVDVFDLTLDNTARIDGELVLGGLNVDGADNAIDNLNVISNGNRNTVNTVQSFGTTNATGNDVNTLTFEGTQDLNFNVVDMASVGLNPAGDTTAATVDGSALTGDLTLAVNGGTLDNEVDDSLTGTQGESDLVALYGNVTTNTSIDGFETLQFGWHQSSDLAETFGTTMMAASGTFDAANTTGIDTFIIGRLAAGNDFGITSLRNGDTVQFGDTTGSSTQVLASGFVGDITLTGAGTTAQDTLTINTVADLASDNFGGFDLNVNNFTNVNVNLDRSNDADNTQASTIGGEEFLNASITFDDAARSFVLTGGDADEDNNLNLTEELNTSLTSVDFSGYDGEITVAGWDSLLGTNATVAVNEYDFTFDLGTDNGSFSVPASSGGPAAEEVQTIDFNGAADLAAGDSIVITFAGGQYVFTNTTADPILAADIADAIEADTASIAPDSFDLNEVAPGVLELTATIDGDMPLATVTDESGVAIAGIAQATTTAGDLAATQVTGFDMVNSVSDYITSFDFNEDAAEAGVVWQIDGFLAFEAGANVDLSNQTIIDLRDLGVDSATDIVVQDGATYWASLTAEEQAVYSAAEQVTLSQATNAVVTSNEGLNYTIVLTGVDAADLVNENFAGIA